MHNLSKEGQGFTKFLLLLLSFYNNFSYKSSPGSTLTQNGNTVFFKVVAVQCTNIAIFDVIIGGQKDQYKYKNCSTQQNVAPMQFNMATL